MWTTQHWPRLFRSPEIEVYSALSLRWSNGQQETNYLNTNKSKELIIDFTKSKHRFNSRPSIPKSSS